MCHFIQPWQSIAFLLSAGQESDYTRALPLLQSVQTSAVLADKGYDAEYIIRTIEDMGAQPPKSNRKVCRDYDKHLYKERNLIERIFNKLNILGVFQRDMIKSHSAFYLFFIWLVLIYGLSKS